MAKLTETTGERRFTLDLNETEARYLVSILSYTNVEGKFYEVDKGIFNELLNKVATLDNILLSGSITIEDDE